MELWNFMTSPIVGMMIQSDELHHFSGGLKNHQPVLIMGNAGSIPSPPRNTDLRFIKILPRIHRS